MASTITCDSCGMQYDGSGMQPGVQFKCTGCGDMVLVGGAAAAVGARPGTRRLPARGGGGRGGPVGRGPTRQMGTGQQQQPGMPYGAPRKKDNSALIIGGVVGAIVLGLIVAVVVMASGPSKEQVAKEHADDKFAQEKKRIEKEDAQRKKANDAMDAIYRAAEAMGPKIAEALSAKDDGGFFRDSVDWGLMAAKQREYIEGNKAFLNDPLYSAGKWVKEERGGKIIYKYEGEAARGPDDLRERFQWYFGFRYQGAEATYLKQASEHEEAAFNLKIGNRSYLGKRIQVSSKAGGKSIDFYVGAEEGTTKVAIIWIEDKGAKDEIQKKEMPHERVRPKDPDQDPQAIGPRNPDPRDPMNPDRPDPGVETPPSDEPPEAVKTGDTPPQGVLSNTLRDIRDGTRLTDAQVKSVQNVTEKEDKKKFLGACVDIIMDMRAKNDRAGISAATSNLLRIFKNMLSRDDSEYTYDFQMGGDPSTDDRPVRCWYEFYVSYKT